MDGNSNYMSSGMNHPNTIASSAPNLIRGANGTPGTTRTVGLPPAPPTRLYREQDQYMPIANIIRIMRRNLPPHAKIADDAKETVQECVSEFISFVTEEANDKCHKEQRKTITADDLIWALGRLGFDSYVGPLSLYLNRYREAEGNRGPRYGLPSLGPGHEPMVRPGAGFGPGQGYGLMPAPAIMPPVPGFFGLAENQAYYNDGPGPNDGSSSNGNYGVDGVSNNGQNDFGNSQASANASSSEDDLGYLDILTQFK